MKSLAFLFVLFGCVTKQTIPTPEVPEAPEVEGPEVPQVPEVASNIETLVLIARASKCAQVSWSGHGKLPAGYYQGMALAYAKAICRVSDPEDGFGQIMNQPLKSSSVDALTHYGLPAGIKSLYTLQIGLGVRESDGRYWIGRDTTATNSTSSTAEAGMFQTSYNSASAHPILPSLMTYYKANPSKCRLEVFKQGYSGGSSSNFGSGQGYEFQKLAKSCPMFAAEWAAVTLRNLRKHYGPINRKEAQVKSECGDMLSMIAQEVKRAPSLCRSL